LSEEMRSIASHYTSTTELGPTWLGLADKQSASDPVPTSVAY